MNRTSYRAIEAAQRVMTLVLPEPWAAHRTRIDFVAKFPVDIVFSGMENLDIPGAPRTRRTDSPVKHLRFNPGDRIIMRIAPDPVSGDSAWVLGDDDVIPRG